MTPSAGDRHASAVPARGGACDGCTVLLLPDWRGPVPGDWQSRWVAAHGFEMLQQDDWQWPRRGDWMARLDGWLLDAVPTAPGALSVPVVLAAHGLGCHLVAAWADHSRLGRRVRGALLVAPPELERDGLPAPVRRWSPVRRRLPFEAALVHGDEDPWCTEAEARRLAADWGAERLSTGPRDDSAAVEGDPGSWPEGIVALRRLCAAATG